MVVVWCGVRVAVVLVVWCEGSCGGGGGVV